MFEIIIIVIIALIFYLLLRKFPQINEDDLKIRSKKRTNRSFNWFSVKRKLKAFFNSLPKRLARLPRNVVEFFKKLGGKEKKLNTESMEEKKKRKIKVNITKSFQKARKLFEEGEYDKAEVVCLRLISLKPQEAKFYHLLHEIYKSQDNLKEAVLSLKEAVERNEDGFWMKDLAELYVKLEKLEEAERYAQKAVEMNNTIAARFAFLARVQKKRDKNSQALENIKKALEKEPNNRGYQELRDEIEKKVGN